MPAACVLGSSLVPCQNVSSPVPSIDPHPGRQPRNIAEGMLKGTVSLFGGAFGAVAIPIHKMTTETPSVGGLLEGAGLSLASLVSGVTGAVYHPIAAITNPAGRANVPILSCLQDRQQRFCENCGESFSLSPLYQGDRLLCPTCRHLQPQDIPSDAGKAGAWEDTREAPKDDPQQQVVSFEAGRAGAWKDTRGASNDDVGQLEHCEEAVSGGDLDLLEDQHEHSDGYSSHTVPQHGDGDTEDDLDHWKDGAHPPAGDDLNTHELGMVTITTMTVMLFVGQDLDVHEI